MSGISPLNFWDTRSINRLGLMNTKQRIRAITALQPCRTVKELEGFIGLAIWNRHLIPFFTKRIAPLQTLKTKLLGYQDAKDAQAKSKSKRMEYARRTRVELSVFGISIS